MNDSSKVLGTPIGGVSDVDGDGDGMVTGPSGEDNIPAPLNKITKRAKDITADLKVYFTKYKSEAGMN